MPACYTSEASLGQETGTWEESSRASTGGPGLRDSHGCKPVVPVRPLGPRHARRTALRPAAPHQQHSRAVLLIPQPGLPQAHRAPTHRPPTRQTATGLAPGPESERQRLPPHTLRRGSHPSRTSAEAGQVSCHRQPRSGKARAELAVQVGTQDTPQQHCAPADRGRSPRQHRLIQPTSVAIGLKESEDGTTLRDRCV